jgi:hypothetical protein
MTTSSVQDINLRIMNGALPFRGGINVPYTFNPGANANVATGASVPATNATKDRLIVGVDFGTTYSGGYSIHCRQFRS